MRGTDLVPYYYEEFFAAVSNMNLSGGLYLVSLSVV
jgi:hypothetical protein